MAKAQAWETDLLKLTFNATNIANIADNAATSPLTNIYISLHTADPTETGNQTSSEATYTSYARVAVIRTTAGWTVTAGTPSSVTNAAAVTFPQCTGGSSTVTYIGIGTASSGTGKLLYTGALTSSLAVSNNITPSFAIGALTITED
jgi:hypothetical protein